MTTTPSIPPVDRMYQALLDRDAEYEGLFVFGVRTTGIFCRPTCPARKPKRENIQFFSGARDALAAGFRPCLRCRPLSPLGAAPEWLEDLLDRIESDPARRWRDEDLRDLGIEPARVRRWFKDHHGITFHTYLRTRRLASAIGQIRSGSDVTSAAFDQGYESLSAFRDSLRKWIGATPSGSRNAEPLSVNRILTPLGPMIAAASEQGLCLLEFADRRMLQTQFQRIAGIFKQPIAPGDHPLISQAERELEEYFAGKRKVFSLPLRREGTPFQMPVWEALLAIPYGETLSYDQLAKKIGRPTAQRAVGNANGDNRLAIVVPCHRVIRGDGSLGGYGGGVWRKKWLLEHERGVVQGRLF
jgi:AraC family transcriptional regulator of adaptative response/methylated-DNA-[protein]-cysteine methyltransferase